jgi:hypothetical protein
MALWIDNPHIFSYHPGHNPQKGEVVKNIEDLDFGGWQGTIRQAGEERPCGSEY